MIRRYSELKNLSTFQERYEYLKLKGVVGYSTFGPERYVNQAFYHSGPWLEVRDYVIVRDGGFDLGINDPMREITDRIIIHHMNPIDLDDILDVSEFLLDPEFLISTSPDTHSAIHYGDPSKLKKVVLERTPNDTTLWKRGKNWKVF